MAKQKGVRRWIIQRKSDGMYWQDVHSYEGSCDVKRTKDLYKACLLYSEKQADIHCDQFTERVIPVIVTIERVKPLAAKGGRGKK